MANYRKINIRDDDGELLRDQAPAANGRPGTSAAQSPVTAPTNNPTMPKPETPYAAWNAGAEPPAATYPTYPTVGGGAAPAAPATGAAGTAPTKTQKQTQDPAAQSPGVSTPQQSGGGTSAAGGTEVTPPSAAAPTYVPSQTVLDAKAYLEKVSQQIPNPYVSSYDDDIMSAYQAIMNRGKFSYDLQGDPMYQQYRDQYVQGGRMAMLDTMGRAQAQTGGYGSSYAEAAGQGAYQAYLQQLNDVALDTYDRAYERYLNEGDQAVTRLNAAMAADQEAYGRYRDQLNAALAERDYAYGAYQDAYAQDYGKYGDDRAYAYETALGMIQSGLRPSAELLAAAGLSEADAQTLVGYYTPKPSYGGYAGGNGSGTANRIGSLPINIDAGTKKAAAQTAAQISSEAAAVTTQAQADAVVAQINAAVDNGMSTAQAMALLEKIPEQYRWEAE